VCSEAMTTFVIPPRLSILFAALAGLAFFLPLPRVSGPFRDPLRWAFGRLFLCFFALSFFFRGNSSLSGLRHAELALFAHS